MKNIIILIIFINTFLCAGTTTNSGIYISDDSMQNTEVQSKLQDLMSKLDYDHFIDSFEMDFGDIESCGSNNMGIPGIALCYDEPVMMADYSPEPLKIQSLGLALSNDPSKSGYTRKSLKSSNMFGHTNLIKFPLLGMIFDNKLLCMSTGDLALAYLSAFDPLYDGMHTRMAFLDVEAFFKPHLMLLGFVDCMSSSVDSYTSALSTTGGYISQARMAFPNYFGCWNAFPMGGFATQHDPILGGATSVGYALASCMRTGILGKTVKIKGMDGAALPDSMCGEKMTPLFVKPQFLYQLIDPTASRTVPLGAIAQEWAEFKNTPESLDESAFWIWQRKCLYVGAAKCSK